MGRRIVHSTGAPSSPLYSQAVKAGEFVYLSGFIGVDPRTKKLAGGTVGEQTRQAIQNCESVLKDAGSDLGNVAQVTVLLNDPNDFEGMNREYTKWFTENPPARMVTKLGVNLPNVKVSIAMTALAKADSG